MRFAAGLLAMALLAPAAAAEEALPAALSWSAPAGCIGAAELAARVSARLGRPAFVDGAPAEVNLVGVIEGPPAGGFQARFRLLTGQGGLVGVRTIASEGRDCRSLDEALVVVLSVMLNVRREDVEAAPVPWRPRSAVGAGVVGALLPVAALEATAAGGVQHGAWAFELELGLQLAPSWEAAEGQLRATAALARLGVSRTVAGGDRVALAVRLAGGAGARWTSSDGFDVNRRRVSFLVDARMGPRLGLRLGRGVWVEVFGDLGLSPVRPRFELLFPDGQTQILYRPGLVYGVGGLGLAAR
jgi:hypothetical protein